MGKFNRIIVRGTVQGVCFRAKTQSMARSHNMRGQVKNLADGSVEILLEGSRDEAEKLIEALKQAGDTYEILSYTIEEIEKESSFQDFQIAY